MTIVPGATAYDAVVYPSTLFPSTHPDRLATIARLHGLDAPPIETARVLEIGGGDGVNAIAMAMAYPDARFLSFDLSTTAAMRGARIVAATGLTNIQVAAGDICDAARDLAQPFDYIIAHGVYAWVPEVVRQAIMVLIGRVLSPNGVAFISYNALPGGHLRKIVREMTLDHVASIADPDERMTAAQAFLEAYAQPREDDRPLLQAMRDVARPISQKRLAVLFHDELGEVFEPQSLTQVVNAAAEHGLGFLNDANTGMLEDGFPRGALSEADVLTSAQAADYATMAFFHSTLLIRDGRKPSRSPNAAGIASLYMASRATRIGGHQFSIDGKEFTIGDDRLADALSGLAEIWPARVEVGDVAEGEERLQILFQLFHRDIIDLHTGPLPGVRVAGERPVASALARFQVGEGSKAVFTLDHRVVALADPGVRAFVAMLDGSRDRQLLERDWVETGFAKDIGTDAALDQLAAAALLTL